jgi:hypothetical protein
MPGLALYYSAFWDLSTCRQVGFGIGPIPLTAIWEYADRKGLDEGETDDLVDYMREMDGEYVKYKSKEARPDDG